MAQELIGFKLQIDGKEKIVSSLGEMKKLLKDANFELLAAQKNFGDYSEEAKAAAKRVAELKDTIQEARETSDLFDPGKKFQAFAGAASAVAGGFGAVQGAMNLVGIESGNVEKALLKVQSAMALSQGLSTIADARKDFARLGSIIKDTSVVQGVYNFVMKGTINGMSLQNAITKATSVTMNFFKTSINGVKTASITAAGAMRALRGIMASLGIGALIYGVTILIDKISSWVGSTDDAKRANDRLNETIDEQNRLFERNREALRQAREDAIMEAKIKGKSLSDIYNITKDFNQKDIKLSQDNYNQKKKDLEDFAKKNLETYTENGKLRVRGSEQDIEQYKKLTQEFNDADNTLRESQRASIKSDQEEKLRIADEGRDKAQKSNDKAKALRDKQIEQEKKDREERIQAEKDAAQRILDLQDEVFLQSITDETQRALVKLSQDKERQINEINATKATSEQKAAEILLVEQKFQQDKTKIETDAATERKEKEKKDAEDAATKLAEKLKLEGEIRVAAIKDEFERKKAELLLQEEQEKADLQKKRDDGIIGEDAYQQGLLNIKAKYVEAETELKKKQAEDERKIQEARKAAQLDFLDTVGQGFGALSSLFGQGTAASKAFALGEIAINTATGFARGMSIAQQSAAGTGPGAAFAYPIFYAQQVIAVLNAVNKARSILKTVKGGGGSTAPTSAPTAPSAAAPIAPQSAQATLTQLDQSSINRLGSATSRAYVVESDITNSQERIRRINRAARLN